MAKIIPIRKDAPIIPKGLNRYLEYNPDGLRGIHFEIVYLIKNMTYSNMRKTVRISCREMSEFLGYYLADTYPAVRFLIHKKVIARYPQINGSGKYSYGLHDRFLPEPRPSVKGHKLKAVK